MEEEDWQAGMGHGAACNATRLELVVQALEQLQQQLPHDELGRDAVGQQLVQLPAHLEAAGVGRYKRTHGSGGGGGHGC